MPTLEFSQPWDRDPLGWCALRVKIEAELRKTWQGSTGSRQFYEKVRRLQWKMWKP